MIIKKLILIMFIFCIFQNSYSSDFEIIVQKEDINHSLVKENERRMLLDDDILYKEGEVLIKFKQEPNISTKNSTNSYKNQLLVTDLDEIDFINVKIVKLKDLTVKEAIELYKDHPQIEYIEPNYKIKSNMDISQNYSGRMLEESNSEDGKIDEFPIPNDPDYSKQWGLEKIQIRKAWAIEEGDDIVIAVIDSGIDYNHEDLKDNIWTNPGEIPDNGIDDDNNGYIDDVHGYDFSNRDNDPKDDYSQGTLVSGLIAAKKNNNKGIAGVNPNAKIMPLKTLDGNGGGWTSTSAKAIEYAIKNKAKIINYGYGGGGSYSSSVKDEIRQAHKNGILVVTIAGNKNREIKFGGKNFYPASYAKFGDIYNLVANAMSTKEDELDSRSNYGKKIVGLMGPGVDIYGPIINNGYGYNWGTSFPTALTTGVLSLIYSVNPELTHLEAKEILLNSVDKIDGLEEKLISGGRLNAYKAVIAAKKSLNPDDDRSVFIDEIILNSSLGKNYSNENLTANPINLNPNNAKLIYDWKVDNKSIAILNVPMDGGAICGNRYVCNYGDSGYDVLIGDETAGSKPIYNSTRDHSK
jgi:subtilisin family serine protease